MVFLLEEIHLEGEDGEEFVDIATDVLDAVFLPSPDFRGDVVIDGDVCPRFYIFGDLQVEARIVHQDDAVRLPRLDILFAELHVLQDGRKVQQHGDQAHIGQVAIMADTCAADGRHQVAAEETEVCLVVNFLQRAHQVGGVEVARGFADYEIILHLRFTDLRFTIDYQDPMSR